MPTDVENDTGGQVVAGSNPVSPTEENIPELRHPVTRGSDYAELPTNLGPRRSLQVVGPHLSDGQMLAGSTPVGPTLYA